MPPARPRRIEYMDVDDLADAPTNAKRHDDGLIDASFKRFRLIETPVLDDRTGRLVAGHGRRDALRAMREAGEPAPEGVTVTKDGKWLTPVTRGWSSRDDYEAEAAGIALNRVGEAGGWNERALAASLVRLSEGTDDMLAGVGYGEDELKRLLATLAEPTPPPEFPKVDESIPVDYCCPSCGYEWSGTRTPGKLTDAVTEP